MFGIDNSTVSEAKYKRIKKQYYLDEKSTPKEYKELSDKANNFLDSVDEFEESLNEQRREQLLKLFKETHGIE